MSVGTVYEDFVHERKLDSVFRLGGLLDLVVRPRLLVEELRAREANDLESILFILGMQLDERLVILLGERSVACNITDESTFLSDHEITENPVFEVDVGDGDWPQFLD